MTTSNSVDDGTSSPGEPDMTNEDSNDNDAILTHSQRSACSADDIDLNKGRDFYDDGYSEEVDSLNDRITFDPREFYGRAKELRTLHAVYQSMFLGQGSSQPQSPTSPQAQPETAQNRMSPVALISGHSGCGKSRLVQQFIHELELQGRQEEASGGSMGEKEKSGPVTSPKSCRSSAEKSNRPFWYLAGKFEELQCADPFSAISQAFSGFCTYLLDGGKDTAQDLERVRADVTGVIGGQVGALTNVIPLLQDVLDLPSPGSSNSMRAREGSSVLSLSKRRSSLVTSATTSARVGENAWNSLKYLFVALVKAIAKPDRPVIMFLDDLQWADGPSLDLMTALLTDNSLQYFMFIGSVRSSEVDDNHVVMKRMRQIQQQMNRKPIERIEVTNMSLEEIGEFVANVLRMTVEETQPLTEAIYSKTRGNMFFAMQALEELERKKVLFYSVLTFQWEWNLDGIEKTDEDGGGGISDNVVDAVAAKIQTAPPKLQKALVVAAYTRSTIDSRTLQELMAVNDCIISSEELCQLLDRAVLDGLLSNSVGSQNYKFAHDRIQEAATSLVLPGQERNDLKVKIGKRLFELATSSKIDDDSPHSKVTSKGNDWMLFVAADHLNSTISKDVSILYKAKLNLLVGERATAFAAFVPASMYLRKSLEAIRQIPSHWTKHYDLSLRLYRASSDVELVLGNYELGNELGQQVLAHTEALQDKLPTYLSLAEARGTQERHEESMNLVRTALLLLEEYPKRGYLVHLILSQTAVKKFFRKHTDSEILTLPMMTDEKKLTTMGFLKEAAIRTYHCGNMIEFMLVVLKMLRITFKYGLCGFSAHAFACYGLFLCGAYGDQEGGSRQGRLAREVLAVTNAKHLEGLVLFTVSYFIDAFSVPHDKMLETYQRAHRAGMETGDLESGFRNWMSSNYHAYVSGYPLDPVEKTGTELVEQLQLYNVESILSLTLEIRLPIRYLVGRSDRPLDWDDLVNEIPEYNGDPSETFRFLHAYLGRLELAVYMRELGVAEQLADKLMHIASNDSAYLPLTCRTFFTGLMASGLAHRTGLGKYKSRARALTAEMKRIVKTRGLNSLPKYLLMQADLLACTSGKKKSEKVRLAYDEAVSAALKIGATQDGALASELAGEYFARLEDDPRRKQYFQQAHDLYLEWGALKKLEHLQRHWGAFIDRSSVIAHSMSQNNWVSSEFRSPVVGDISGEFSSPLTEFLSSSLQQRQKIDRDRDEISCLTMGTA